MKHYQRRLAINATPEAIYAALAIIDGLRGWWTRDCHGKTAVGDVVVVRFGQTHKELRIETLRPGREVRWLCTDARIAADSLTRCDEWVGTELVFRLAPDREVGTRLDFEHVGLVPSIQCYAMCCDGWRYYLDSLKRLLERGQGTPYPTSLAAAA